MAQCHQLPREETLNAPDWGHGAKQRVKGWKFPATYHSTPDIRNYFRPVPKPIETTYSRSDPGYGPTASDLLSLPVVIKEDWDTQLVEKQTTDTACSSSPFKHSVTRWRLPTGPLFWPPLQYRHLSKNQPFHSSLSTIVEEDFEDYRHEPGNPSLVGVEHPVSVLPEQPQNYAVSSDLMVPYSTESEFDYKVDSDTIPWHDDEYEILQSYCDAIYIYRDNLITEDAAIHHFSWTGHRVYHYSATSPSESLAIILATPKVPHGTNIWRMQAVLTSALPFIDPVVVLLDGTDENVFQLRGSELIKALTGQVLKFYSPHGLWMEDPNDSSDITTYDTGTLNTYQAPGLAIGNGFYGIGRIRPVSNWIDQRLEAFEKLNRLDKLPRRRTWHSKPSPLRECQTITIPETPRKPTPLPAEHVRKSRSTIPRSKATTASNNTRHVYVSFPPPVFRFSKTKAFAKTVMTGIRKGLEYLRRLAYYYF